MNILGSRIKKERENLNLTREELAQKLNVSYSAIAMYEQGNREPNNSLLIKMRDIFNCSIDYLLGKTDIRNFEKTFYVDTEKIIEGIMAANGSSFYIDEIKTLESLKSVTDSISNSIINIPIVGKIAAGQPILAEEYLEGYLPVDPNIYGVSTGEDLFYLRVSGQSMNLKVKNGDYALIKKQDYAEDLDIIVAIVNGADEATLKKYKKLNEQFVLLEPMSSDSTIEAITVDLKTTEFKIIGKAIGQFGKF